MNFLKEFKPTILFLIKFAGMYLVLNLIYGFYVTSYYPESDPVTRLITEQTSAILSFVGWPVATYNHANHATTSMIFKGKVVLSVYEGCNAINTMIIFITFVVAFGPFIKKMIFFVFTGLVIIYLVNLARILFLFFVTQYFPNFMYFTHKYLFTAILYVVIFILWIAWVRMIPKPAK
jgi:exosortase family protein XrtF